MAEKDALCRSINNILVAVLRLINLFVRNANLLFLIINLCFLNIIYMFSIQIYFFAIQFTFSHYKLRSSHSNLRWWGWKGVVIWFVLNIVLHLCIGIGCIFPPLNPVLLFSYWILKSRAINRNTCCALYWTLKKTFFKHTFYKSVDLPTYLPGIFEMRMAVGEAYTSVYTYLTTKVVCTFMYKNNFLSNTS